jgi:hypothetical protein
VISARTLELLRLGLIDTDGQIHMDLGLLDGRSVNEVDTQVLDHLPDVVKNRPGSWLEGFRRTCSDLISDIESGGEPRPRCTAEEFVLGLTMTRLEDFVTLNYAIAEAAVAHLPASDDDLDLDAAHRNCSRTRTLTCCTSRRSTGFWTTQICSHGKASRCSSQTGGSSGSPTLSPVPTRRPTGTIGDRRSM